MAICNGIGARIKELREAKGWTQTELAKKLYVRRETIAQWETEARDLKTDYTIMVADLFGVSCDYILRGIKTENVDINKLIGLSDDAIDVLKCISAVAPSQREKYSGIAMVDVLDFILSSAEFYLSFWHKEDENFMPGPDIFYCLLTYFVAPEFSGNYLYLDSLGDLKHPLQMAAEFPINPQTSMIPVDPNEFTETYLLERIKKLIIELKTGFWSKERRVTRQSHLPQKRDVLFEIVAEYLERYMKGAQNGEHSEN